MPDEDLASGAAFSQTPFLQDSPIKKKDDHIRYYGVGFPVVGTPVVPVLEGVVSQFRCWSSRRSFDSTLY